MKWQFDLCTQIACVLVVDLHFLAFGLDKQWRCLCLMPIENDIKELNQPLHLRVVVPFSLLASIRERYIYIYILYTHKWQVSYTLSPYCVCTLYYFSLFLILLFILFHSLSFIKRFRNNSSWRKAFPCLNSIKRHRFMIFNTNFFKNLSFYSPNFIFYEDFWTNFETFWTAI